MIRRTVAAAAMLGLALAAASAQPLSVDYVFGTAEALAGAQWNRLAAGAEVDAGTTLRLAPEAVVELVTGGARVTIAAPGIYLVSDVIGRRTRADSRLAAFLHSTLRTLVSPPRETVAPVGGGRAGVPAEPAPWVDEDEQALERAEILLSDGRTAEARDVLIRARPQGGGTQPFDFLIAWSAALEGRTGIALGILRKLDTGTAMRYRDEALVLHAQLALDAEAPAEALAAARACLAQPASATSAQRGLLLEGLALRALGSEAESRVSFERALKAGPDTEAAQAAARELNR